MTRTASPDPVAAPPGEAASGHLETSDLGDYIEFAKPWDVRLNQIAAGRFHAEVEYVATPNMLIYEERWLPPMEVTGATPEGFFMLGTSIASHEAPLEWCGEPVDRRRFACRASGGAIDFTTPARSDHVVLLVRPALLASAVGEEAADALAGQKHLELSPENGNRLVNAITTTVRRCAAGPAALDDHEGRHLESHLLGTLSRCNGDLRRVAPRVSTSVRRAAVRRAVEWADQSVEAITALELAVAVGVSQRTLEYGFQEVLGVTPASYLRVHRLNNAHRELCSADPGSTAVGRVAMKWGFGHPGRFAVAYRKHFGETPSATLARTRRRSVPRLADVIPPRGARGSVRELT